MYLLAEPELYVNGIIKLTPIWYRDRMRTICAHRFDFAGLAQRHRCVDGCS